MSFIREIGRIYILGALATLVIAVGAWMAFVDSMGIAHRVPIWRRLLLPRSANVSGSEVRVPFAFGILQLERGVRVVYRFPPLTRAQATFIVQVQRDKDSTARSRPAKTLARCDTLPPQCTTWFADPPSNRLACTEARLATPTDGDLGNFGFCYPRLGPVHGIYSCDGATCATARNILSNYFRRRLEPVSDGGG